MTGRHPMDSRFTAQDNLLNQGPRPPRLPTPGERRRLRELWGATLEEVADALNVEPEVMAAWEAGRHTADPADAYAYLRLLNAFREQLPAAYEPDWAALRKPPASPAPASAVSGVPTQADTARGQAKPSRRGASWTQEEKDRLRAEFLAGAQVPQLAESLGRSEKAVRWVLHRLGLISFPADDVPAPRTGPEKPKAYTVADKRRIHPNAYQPWSAEDEQRLAERCAQGASLAELSREFGRNEGGIASRLIKIKADGPAADEAWAYGGEGPGADL
ncbi:helix-turn-helix domain-containing protein [Streptomyces sp. MNU76]|uniref:helix-turn-helix domain-containing protein n=1 Tax=Streptomyces sp. MNU76 TaxID=2560026 RepID=UPI001E61046C|nr:helix-turn-helix transcriptional regulator [Streptomyces sp. MNU76]MCC9711652.1 helix-turn-helix domain-containing protein [Streptomyces sp. MNU76]